MSTKVIISFQVTDMLIMEQSLKKLKHEFSKNSNGLSIKRSYQNIDITKEQITYDSMDRNVVEKIMYEFQKDFQVHERIIRGELFEVTETSNEIVILVN